MQVYGKNPAFICGFYNFFYIPFFYKSLTTTTN